MNHAKLRLAVVVGILTGLVQLADSSEVPYSLWANADRCEVAWVATVKSFDGMEVIFQVDQVLRGPAQDGPGRLIMVPGWSLVPPTRPVPPLPLPGAEPAAPQPVAPEQPTTPNTYGMVVGKQYVVFGQRYDAGLYAQPHRPGGMATELTDDNRAETMAAVEKCLELSALDDPVDRAVGLIEAIKGKDGEPWQELFYTVSYLSRRVLRDRDTTAADKDRVASALMTLLDDENPAIRIAALQTLHWQPGPEWMAKVADATGDDDDKVAAAAVRALVQDPTPEALDILLALAQHASPARRAMACKKLYLFSDERASAVQVELLDDPDADVRAAAATAMQGLFQSNADVVPVAKLLAMLDDPEPTIRTGAARALQACPNEEPIRPLLDKLLAAETEPNMRGVISSALQGMIKNDVGRQLVAAERDRIIAIYYENGGWRAYKLLKAIGLSKSLDMIIADTRSDDPELQQKACWLLAAFGEPRSRAAIVALLDDDDDNVRGTAIRVTKDSISRSGDVMPGAETKFVDLLKSPSDLTKAQALRALEDLAFLPSVTEAILAGLKPSRGLELATRQKLVKILARIYPRTRESMAELIAADLSPYVAVLTESTDVAGAEAAIKLLRHIGTPEAIAALSQAAESHAIEEIRQRAKAIITPPAGQ